MIKVNFRFLPALILVTLLGLIASCNRIDKDINPDSQPNNPVIATDDATQVFPGSRVVIDLLKNDKITTSASISLLKDYLKRGTATFIKQGVVLYTPNDSSGIDTLAYSICPPGQPCDTGAIKITISGDTSNNPCFGAMPDFASVKTGDSVNIFVLNNDSFCDSTATDSSSNNNRVVDIVESPKNGNVKITGTYLTYSPNQGFNGTDWLVYGVRNATSNTYLGYGVTTIFVGDSTNNPNDSCTIKALDDYYTASSDSISPNGQYIYVDVLANDSLCGTTANYTVVGTYGNPFPTFENGRLKVFLGSNNTDSITVRYRLTKGNQTSEANAYIKVTQNGNCQVTATHDTYAMSADSIPTAGKYYYFDVLANDELCNDSPGTIVTINGGLNTPPVFENGKLKVKLYPTNGTVQLQYGLTKNGGIVYEANVNINISPVTVCQIKANHDSLSVPLNELTSGGKFVTVDVLANDDLCNYASGSLTYDITFKNTNAYFENGKLKVYVDDTKSAFEVIYKVTAPATGSTQTQETQTSLIISIK